jgi:alkylglycerol monooxygenase
MENLLESVSRLGYLFYIVSPKASSFETIESVPDYITEVIPYFISLIVIEQIIAFYKGFKFIRINDAIASLSQGIFMELTKYLLLILIYSKYNFKYILFQSYSSFIFRTLFKSIALIYYIYIYENWRICSLHWDSMKTWGFALIVVDFGFYWIHRATHG